MSESRDLIDEIPIPSQEEIDDLTLRKLPSGVAATLAKNPHERKVRTFSEVVRRFLETKKQGLDGLGRTRQIQLIAAMFNCATNPKSSKQVEAAKLLLARAYGKEQANEEEMEALKKGAASVKIVLITPPKDIEPGKTLPPPKPDFIDAEVVER